MRRFAVGDLQGNLTPLLVLLDRVGFVRGQDELWVVGDLVNKGPENVEVLQFLSELPRCQVVLGNHDLHLLAVAAGTRKPRRKDTLNDILDYPGREPLLNWLSTRPLLVRDDTHRQVMVHAGIPPVWTVDDAARHARVLESVLASPDTRQTYLADLYGNEDFTTPGLPSKGPAYWRALTNYFTRMRFASADGGLEFAHSGPPEERPDGFAPWYELREPDGWQIVFGHWAALLGDTRRDDCIGLDTGYCWGNWLTLYDLDTGERHTERAS